MPGHGLGESRRTGLAGPTEPVVVAAAQPSGDENRHVMFPQPGDASRTEWTISDRDRVALGMSPSKAVASVPGSGTIVIEVQLEALRDG